jgi:hypothetical protein
MIEIVSAVWHDASFQMALWSVGGLLVGRYVL